MRMQHRAGAGPNDGHRRSRYLKPWLAAVVLLLAFGSLTGGLLARYVTKYRQENEMVADRFHISSKLLKESAPAYIAPVGTDGTFAVELYNYEVENIASVSDMDITYTISVVNGTVASVKNGDSVVTAAAGAYTLPSGPDRTAHTITVQPTDPSSAVTVTVTATAPYVKTLSASFTVSGLIHVIQTVEDDITYLDIETNQYEGRLSLKWADGLYPSAGVNETDYGWTIGYTAKHAYIANVEKETTYHFEFNSVLLDTIGDGSDIVYTAGEATLSVRAAS